MSTYIYSKWKTSPPGSPTEFYSELDSGRFEVRKVEIFKDGRHGYASAVAATLNTRLGNAPVPQMSEIKAQPEFETREVTPMEFEKIWRAATAK